MNNIIITCNAGSSNIKLAVFDSVTLTKLTSIKVFNEAETYSWLKQFPAENILAIGHRVVHGGDKFVNPTLITPQILNELTKFIPLAPLHQPISLKFIVEISKLTPNTPQIAYFDTAFHQTIPEIERILPLQKKYYDSGIKRYGFHGLSYEYIVSTLPENLKNQRIIIAHLGNGSSVCAIREGKSTATTMGFSTLDGLMMGTRAGTIDAGVILYLLQQQNMPPHDIETLLYKESGLLGISGISSDMQKLEASNDTQATLAIELYCHIAAKNIASLIPSIGGIDALIFTGGIGENSKNVRERIVSQLQWLNKIEMMVIPTNEELVIAKACQTFSI